MSLTQVPVYQLKATRGPRNFRRLVFVLLILRAEISYLGRDGCLGAAGVSIDMLSSDAATRIAYPVSDIISVLCAVLCSGDNACVKYTSAQCQVFEG